MSDRPIIFSAPMVRALQEERKTQTRRVLKPQPTWREEALTPGGFSVGAGWCWRGLEAWPDAARFAEAAAECAPYAPGDRLWVRETWRAARDMDALSPAQMAAACREAGYRRAWAPIAFEADGRRVNLEGGMATGRLRSAVHMPRWASRLTLTVTDVRVQRLDEISEADAIAEGVEDGGCLQCGGSSLAPEGCCYKPTPDFRDGFFALWNSIHGPDACIQNPWVCALTFTVAQRNIDAPEAGHE